MNTLKKTRVLFVCMGNICRSPMAEAIFQHLVDKAGLHHQFEIASAATSRWELGEPVHPGTRLVLRNHQIAISAHKRAVQITPADFKYYDYILVMDSENLTALRGVQKAQRLMKFAPAGMPMNVPDPYYTGDFDSVFDMINIACENLLEHIRKETAV